jgi:cobalt-zinc-cadmium efflux system protein
VVTRQQRLWTVLWLNVALLGLLVVVGLRAGSLGLIAAAGDYIADIGAIALALFAIWLKSSHAHDGRFARAPVYAALVNVVLLLVVAAAVLIEASHRLMTKSFEMAPTPVIWTAGIAAAVMAIGALILGGDMDAADDTSADRLNMQAVLLDTIADAVSAAAVAITGLVVLVTGRFVWLDSVVASVIAVVVGYHALELLRVVRRDLKGTGD